MQLSKRRLEQAKETLDIAFAMKKKPVLDSTFVQSATH